MRAQSILVANPKGGAGKSTLATNLSGMLALAGHGVMLGDTDRQQSSRDWLRLRPATLPRIGTWEIDTARVARPPAGTTHAVLDTPAGLHGHQLIQILKRADRVLVPVQPSLFDILATREFLEILLQERSRRKDPQFAAIVGMRVDARTRAAQELERFLSAYDLPILAYLRDTQLYVQAAAHGMTLFDLPPYRSERDTGQWRPIAAWLGI